MGSVEVQVDAVCDACGQRLEGSADMVRGTIIVTITPCQRCLDEAYRNGEEANE